MCRKYKIAFWQRLKAVYKISGVESCPGVSSRLMAHMTHLQLIEFRKRIRLTCLFEALKLISKSLVTVYTRIVDLAYTLLIEFPTRGASLHTKYSLEISRAMHHLNVNQTADRVNMVCALRRMSPKTFPRCNLHPDERSSKLLTWQGSMLAVTPS